MPPERTARLVLVDRVGVVLGALAPVSVSTPWWQDIRPVVEAARSANGCEVTVLRLLEAARASPPGGEVTYLAELTAGAPDLQPWSLSIDDHPLRLAYARPGGPAADLAWGAARLAEIGTPLTDPPAQERTWNLSSLWRLPTAHGAAWLKVVPPFFAHEGALLDALAGEAVPTVIARDGPRLLLAEAPGADLYGAPRPRLLEMVEILVDLQVRWRERTESLLALGLPDWRAPAIDEAIATLVGRRRAGLSADVRGRLSRFLEGLGERMAALAACGLPDTLAHGDFHPGNFRGGGGARLILLDWGDSGVGHPLLDQAAFLDRIAADDRAAVAERWSELWRRAVPGADPDRAARLLAPVAAARQALIYQGFLDRIEPSEHPYHRADPDDWLGRCAALAGP